MRGRPAHRRGAGFTLIELTMVLIILTVLAAILAPRYADAVGRARVNAAAERVLGELNYARARAQASGEGWIVAFDVAGDTMLNRDAALTQAISAENLTNLRDEPYRADITALTTESGSPWVEFNVFGRATTGALITLAHGTNTKQVRVYSSIREAEVLQ